MDEQAFCLWLQGYFEISGAKTIGEKEVKIIKDHLGLVFNKITPNREEKTGDFLKEIDDNLIKIPAGLNPGRDWSSGRSKVYC